MTLTQISALVGIPISILRTKCLRYNKNPNGIFTNLDLNFFSSYFNVAEKSLTISSKINLEPTEYENKTP